MVVMDGADDLATVDALEVDAGDAGDLLTRPGAGHQLVDQLVGQELPSGSSGCWSNLVVLWSTSISFRDQMPTS